MRVFSPRFALWALLLILSPFLFANEPSSTQSSDALVDWFLSEPNTPFPSAYALPIQNPKERVAAQHMLWESYQKSLIKRWGKVLFPQKTTLIQDIFKNQKIHAQSLSFDDVTVPFVILQKGQRPQGGWPVFFCMHGGGANPRATSPHSWQVNTSEWVAQMQLASTQWPSPGLYIIPRMGDDRLGRWYLPFVQDFIDVLRRQAIAFGGANPHRFYLEGISEGGYSAFRLASLLPDYWAGSCAMAAAEPIDNAPPENLRHVAFRCGIGERDTFFDRIGLARRYFQHLATLSQHARQGDYPHFLDIQKKRGHGIDYREGPAWIAQFTRPQHPVRIDWTVISQADYWHNRAYWLVLQDKKPPLPLNIQAEWTEKNHLSLTVSHQGKHIPLAIKIYADSTFFDATQPVNVTYNGKKVFSQVLKPRIQSLAESLKERGDPAFTYSYAISIHPDA